MPADRARARLFQPTPRERRLYRAARAIALLPDFLKIRISAEPPIVVDGQQLDPQLQVIRSASRGRKLPGLVEPTVAAGRERYRRQIDVFRGPVTRVHAVRDLEIAGAAGAIRARHYAAASAAAPLTVFFHGGGFVIGDIDTHDEPCRILCREADTHVLSVDYRLSPEHPFPAAIDDACASLRWARANARSLGSDPRRLAIGGDSAGGNLSAVVSAATAGGSGPIAQLLIYPATDFQSDRRSHAVFAEGFYLTRADIETFRDAYLAGAGVALDDARVSPLRARSFAGLPPTLVAVAGFDPLRDDGLAYAEALDEAGVPVRTLRFPSLGHGFIHMTGVAPAARHAMRTIARSWRAVLDGALARTA